VIYTLLRTSLQSTLACHMNVALREVYEAAAQRVAIQASVSLVKPFEPAAPRYGGVTTHQC